MLASTWLPLLSLLLLTYPLSCAPQRAQARVTVLGSTNTIQGAVTGSLLNFQKQSVYDYSAVAPATSINLASSSNTDVIAAMTNASVDFAIITTALSAVQASQFILLDTVQYPFAALPLVIVYNIPPFGTCANSASSCPPLVLSRTALCNLFLGNISKWSDPQITATNPSSTTSNAVKLIVANDKDFAETEIVTRFCSKADSTGLFSSSIGYGSVPNWSGSKSANLIYASTANSTAEMTAAAIAQLVDANPYSISYMSWQAALQYGLPFAQMKNKYGNTILLNSSTAQAAVLELASSNANPSYLDLTDASGPSAYPLLGPVYLLMFKLFTRYTCIMRQQLQGYVLWTLTDSAAALNAADQGLVILPSSSQYGTAIYTRMLGDLYCNNGPVYVAPRPSFVASTEVTASFVNVSVARFSDVDSTYRYNTPPSRRYARPLALRLGTIDLALMNPTDWNYTLAGNNSLHAQYASSANLTMLPMLVAAVVPIFSLPPAVLATEADTVRYSAPLFPLALDVDTLAAIVLGRITRWTDAAIGLFNPTLAARFSNSGANPNISMVLCCQQPDENFTATNAFNTMMTVASPVYAAGPYNPAVPITTTLVWNKLVNQSLPNATLDYAGNGAKYLMAYNEGRMRNKVAANPGSIGFAQLTSAQVNDCLTFRLISNSYLPAATQLASANASAAAAVAAAAPAASWQSLSACITPSSLNVTSSTLHIKDASVPSSCWPLSFLVSAVMSSSYVSYGILGQYSGQASDRCTRGKDTIALMTFLTTNATLSNLAHLKGMARVVDNEFVLSAFNSSVQSALQLITCNGASILPTAAGSWTVTTGLKVAGLTVAAVGLLACFISMAVLLAYRNHSFLKSSSTVLLCLAVLGWLLLFVSAILLLVAPTAGVCSSLMWLMSIGWTLTFCPLTLRAWRVWRIFQPSNKLEVVRIPSRSLVTALVVILAIDVATLAVWQQDNPLAPMMFLQPDLLRSASSTTAVPHTHCAVSSVTPGMVAQIVLKSSLLLFALAFCQCTTRYNNAYHEGQSIATLMSTSALILGIVMPAIYVTSAVGDGLLFFLLLPILLIPMMALALLLVPKWRAAYRYWQVGESSAVESAEKDKARLTAHINHLQQQLAQADKALRLQALENNTANSSSFDAYVTPLKTNAK